MLVVGEEDLDGKAVPEQMNEFAKVYVVGSTGSVIPQIESCSML